MCMHVVGQAAGAGSHWCTSCLARQGDGGAQHDGRGVQWGLRRQWAWLGILVRGLRRLLLLLEARGGLARVGRLFHMQAGARRALLLLWVRCWCCCAPVPAGAAGAPALATTARGRWPQRVRRQKRARPPALQHVLPARQHSRTSRMRQPSSSLPGPVRGPACEEPGGLQLCAAATAAAASITQAHCLFALALLRLARTHHTGAAALAVAVAAAAQQQPASAGGQLRRGCC